MRGFCALDSYGLTAREAFARLAHHSTGDSLFTTAWDGIWSVLAVDGTDVREWTFPAGEGHRPDFAPVALAREWADWLARGAPSPEDLSGWDALGLGAPPPFRGGLAGTLGYGTRLAFEFLPDRLRHTWDLPHARLAHFPAVAAYHGPTNTLWMFGDCTRASDWQRRLRSPLAHSSVRTGALQEDLSDEGYAHMVEQVREAIAAGDLFQCNVARRWRTPVSGDTSLLWDRVHAINPSPWAAEHRTPTWSVLSNSPELLLRARGRHMETRPIAGTHPRGGTAADDDRLRQNLSGSHKEKAEHLMLVDLARNDLGRTCTLGSVGVPRLAGLEGYSHVWHIVSTVEGQLRTGLTSLDCLAGLFPCGTITGAPRIRCMELIDQLENTSRGMYTGSLGWVSYHGDAEWNVLIRSATVCAGELSLHTGAGIVWDSDPQREAAETRHKLAAWKTALA